MSAMTPIYKLLGIQTQDFSKYELSIIEAELFVQIVDELMVKYRDEMNIYFGFIKVNKVMEKMMLEDNFLRFIVNDLLSSGDYSLVGLAFYMGTHEDVIYEIASGRNCDPSTRLFRKVIELHREVRKELYENIMKKIVGKYMDSINP